MVVDDFGFRRRLPASSRVAVRTNAGRLGVVIADSLEEHGLVVPCFSERLQHPRRTFVRAETAVGNPFDLVGSNDPDRSTRSSTSAMSGADVGREKYPSSPARRLGESDGSDAS